MPPHRSNRRRAVRWDTIAAAALVVLTWSTGCEAPPAAEPDESPIVGTSLAEAPPIPSSRFLRLTHPQWVRTVNDLFGFDVASDFVTDFRSDPVIAGYKFKNNAALYEVDEAMWLAYGRAARLIVERVASREGGLDSILPPDGDDAAPRARRFIESFGSRAHRRPLSDAEVEAYAALFASGASRYPGVDAFEAGARITLEAMLQSPHFLYRTELSVDEVGGAIPLSGYEVAQRLSYTLWDTMPDDALFEAAATGDLGSPRAVAKQVRRMLDDPRAASVIQAFHEQLFAFDSFGGIFPSRAMFPDVPAGIGDLALLQARLFVQHTVVDQLGSYADLLLSTETFVNAPLARIYGVEGSFGDELVLTSLNPNERRGLLTHVGFLAAKATPVHPDPIHRGVYVAERLACIHLAPPPDDVPPLPAPGEGQTNRETIELLTEQPGTVCARCHETVINPYGFPFEVYDAVGGFRSEDNGRPIDSTASPPIDGQKTPVVNAVDLIEKLATSAGVHGCYSKHWLEYLFGRSSVRLDRALVEKVGAYSLEGASVRELIVGLVTAEAFLNRSLEELP